MSLTPRASGIMNSIAILWFSNFSCICDLIALIYYSISCGYWNPLKKIMANQTPFDPFFFYTTWLGGWSEFFYSTINQTKNSDLIWKQPKNKTKAKKQIKHSKNTNEKILEQNKSNTQKRWTPRTLNMNPATWVPKRLELVKIKAHTCWKSCKDQ